MLELPHSVHLTWVVDIDVQKAQRVAAEVGCRWSTSLDEVLEAVDAATRQAVAMILIVGTTWALHYGCPVAQWSHFSLFVWWPPHKIWSTSESVPCCQRH